MDNRHKTDITGLTQGFLKVIDRVDGSRSHWRCQCSACGKEFEKTYGRINAGLKSCGCLRPDKKHPHGPHGPRIGVVWQGMKQRCYSKNFRSYPAYGGRGITVCEEWRTNSQAFVEWALGNGYARGLQIDRIDNDGPYSPENCRWVTRKENNRNRNNLISLTWKGQTKLLVEWAEELGVPSSVLHARRTEGWDVERMLSTPKKKRGSYGKRKEDEEMYNAEIRKEQVMSLREKANGSVMPIKKAAKLVNVSDRTWNKWERGRIRMPDTYYELFLVKTGQHPKFGTITEAPSE